MSFSNIRTKEISVERKLSSGDGYSEPTFDTATTVQCRVQMVEERVTDQHGDEVRTSTILYFYDTGAIQIGDKATTPDGLTRIVAKVRQSESITGGIVLSKAWLK